MLAQNRSTVQSKCKKSTGKILDSKFFLKTDEAIRVIFAEHALHLQKTNEQAVQSILDSNDEGSDKSLRPFLVADMYQMTQGLEATAVNCHVGGAIIHLKRARKAFLDSKRNESVAVRQLLITKVLKN